MNIGNIFLSFLFFVCLTIVSNAGEKKTPVMYGVDENVDACSSFGMVGNLGKGVDEFLAVKAAPFLKAKRIDKLLKNQTVSICEEKTDWYGVVYTKNREQDCGVSTPIEKRKPYSGPCKSGWVYKKYIRIVGG